MQRRDTVRLEDVYLARHSDLTSLFHDGINDEQADTAGERSTRAQRLTKAARLTPTDTFGPSGLLGARVAGGARAQARRERKAIKVAQAKAASTTTRGTADDTYDLADHDYLQHKARHLRNESIRLDKQMKRLSELAATLASQHEEATRVPEKVQNALRCVDDRLLSLSMTYISSDEETQHDAARRIQACVRGMLQRRRYHCLQAALGRWKRREASGMRSTWTVWFANRETVHRGMQDVLVKRNDRILRTVLAAWLAVRESETEWRDEITRRFKLHSERRTRLAAARMLRQWLDTAQGPHGRLKLIDAHQERRRQAERQVQQSAAGAGLSVTAVTDEVLKRELDRICIGIAHAGLRHRTLANSFYAWHDAAHILRRAMQKKYINAMNWSRTRINGKAFRAWLHVTRLARVRGGATLRLRANVLRKAYAANAQIQRRCFTAWRAWAGASHRASAMRRRCQHRMLRLHLHALRDQARRQRRLRIVALTAWIERPVYTMKLALRAWYLFAVTSRTRFQAEKQLVAAFRRRSNRIAMKGALQAWITYVYTDQEEQSRIELEMQLKAVQEENVQLQAQLDTYSSVLGDMEDTLQRLEDSNAEKDALLADKSAEVIDLQFAVHNAKHEILRLQKIIDKNFLRYVVPLKFELSEREQQQQQQRQHQQPPTLNIDIDVDGLSTRTSRTQPQDAEPYHGMMRGGLSTTRSDQGQMLSAGASMRSRTSLPMSVSRVSLHPPKTQRQDERARWVRRRLVEMQRRTESLSRQASAASARSSTPSHGTGLVLEPRVIDPRELDAAELWHLLHYVTEDGLLPTAPEDGQGTAFAADWVSDAQNVSDNGSGSSDADESGSSSGSIAEDAKRSGASGGGSDSEHHGDGDGDGDRDSAGDAAERLQRHSSSGSIVTTTTINVPQHARRSSSGSMASFVPSHAPFTKAPAAEEEAAPAQARARSSSGPLHRVDSSESLATARVPVVMSEVMHSHLPAQLMQRKRESGETKRMASIFSASQARLASSGSMARLPSAIGSASSATASSTASSSRFSRSPGSIVARRGGLRSSAMAGPRGSVSGLDSARRSSMMSNASRGTLGSSSATSAGVGGGSNNAINNSTIGGVTSSLSSSPALRRQAMIRTQSDLHRQALAESLNPMVQVHRAEEHGQL